jgi:hypothetical protein
VQRLADVLLNLQACHNRTRILLAAETSYWCRGAAHAYAAHHIVLCCTLTQFSPDASCCAYTRFSQAVNKQAIAFNSNIVATLRPADVVPTTC